ncbi:hypothetical protein CALCODRAFT_290844 [Calocera cornea HHB12733]|uniref:Uncharacterized protein n=1 Tax=Calocera cornea HHB12733 TaxID=1353952 RepID=A0A165FT37_9BASI|nr:hypothetical protein CALCODRAFT_290844 [Calocera cornea HHB12733]
MPPRAKPPAYHPPAEYATFRDLLFFEERLKTNNARLKKQKARYQRASQRPPSTVHILTPHLPMLRTQSSYARSSSASPSSPPTCSSTPFSPPTSSTSRSRPSTRCGTRSGHHTPTSRPACCSSRARH